MEKYRKMLERYSQGSRFVNLYGIKAAKLPARFLIQTSGTDLLDTSSHPCYTRGFSLPTTGISIRLQTAQWLASHLSCSLELRLFRLLLLLHARPPLLPSLLPLRLLPLPLGTQVPFINTQSTHPAMLLSISTSETALKRLSPFVARPAITFSVGVTRQKSTRNTLVMLPLESLLAGSPS